MQAREILQKYYGYSEFRAGQEVLINHLLEGKDVLGIMPTGAGKSICYQVPAMVMEGITIVISPLISLMKDQVDALNEVGISAGVINSTLSAAEYRETIQLAMDGHYKLLYVAPERLDTMDFIELSQQLNIAMVAIDEAHCVSQWGHDFRPSYTQIASYIRRLPVRPVVGAFTATATPKVKEDMMQVIELQDPYTLTTGFDRPNLYFTVEKPKQKSLWILNYLAQNTEENGVVYCSTRKSVDALYEKLRQKGIAVGRYHAGLPEQERRQHQEDFIYDRTRIMIATNAFGMGIDKSNVRFVIHYNMPKNMEGYYQEAGRAGRDGVDSTCTLLYSAADIMTNRLLIENGNHDHADLSNEYDKLNQMVDYCNTEGCLRNYILGYFGESPDTKCDNCGNCNSEVSQQDITVEAQKILSCIKRMGERFGTVVVVDVLKGGNTAKIRQFKFDTLSTYGIMKEYHKDVIKEMIAFLIAEKYILLQGDQYPVLALSPHAYGVLKGEEKVAMRLVLEKAKVQFQGDEVSLPKDLELFGILREVRGEIAREQGVPPFMIFSDATLNEMATYYPTVQEEMLMISGVGQIKYDKYGEAFREAITTYIEENDVQKPELHVLEGKRHQSKSSNQEKVVRKTSSGSRQETYLETYTLYKEGMALQDIAKERGLSLTTIENHLIKCLENNLDINYYDFMSEEEERLIQKAIEEAGTGFLKPIKELLPEEVTYTAIKLMIQRQKQA